MAYTSDNIQQQVDDNEELLEEGSRFKPRREYYLHGVLDNTGQSQTDDMMSYATARSGNVRGSSSGSAPSFIPQTAASLLSTASDTATGDTPAIQAVYL